ncbi:hypothetical protein J7M28_04320 [bacterium]|nr:hypothetical protein [bacterium]
MTDKTKERTENGEACYGSHSDGRPPRKPWIKTVILAAVLLAAVALAGHLFSDCSANASTCPFSAVCGSSKDCVSASDCAFARCSCGACSAAKRRPSSTEQSPKKSGIICPLLDSKTNAKETTADKAVIFLLLSGGDVEASRRASDTLESVTAKFEKADLPILTLTLEKGERGFDRMIKQFSITSLPCIVAFGQGCQSSVVKTSDIAEEALGSAFKRAASDDACGTPKTAKRSLKCGAFCPSSSHEAKGK